MNAVVIDTDVVSYLFKSDPRIGPYRTHLLGKQWVISFMTLAELELWTLMNRWGTRRETALKRFLGQFTVCHSDDTVSQLWAVLTDGAYRKGRPIPIQDAWNAAVAMRLNIPLVTNNRKDYVGVRGVTILAAVR